MCASCFCCCCCTKCGIPLVRFIQFTCIVQLSLPFYWIGCRALITGFSSLTGKLSTLTLSTMPTSTSKRVSSSNIALNIFFQLNRFNRMKWISNRCTWAEFQFLKFGFYWNVDMLLPRWLNQINYFDCFVCRQVGKNLIVPGGSRVIDARGKFVMPGRFFLDIKLIQQQQLAVSPFRRFAVSPFRKNEKTKKRKNEKKNFVEETTSFRSSPLLVRSRQFFTCVCSVKVKVKGV